MIEKVNKWKDSEDERDEFDKAFNEEFEKELGGNMEDVLKNLEGELDSLDTKMDEMDENIHLKIDSISDEEKARKLGKAAGKAVKAFVEEFADSTKKSSH
jgi:ABC-type proline/glycine betaine transport system substrate-binding protein